MPNLLGSAPNQCPTNGDLGKLAFMDVVDTVTNNPYLDTAISDTKPSLLLDFANSKTLDPRITYTRASTASYYDGRTTAVAEQNLLTYSQAISLANWLTVSSGVTATLNNTVAPDGTTTGSLIVPTATSNFHTIYQSVTTGTGSVAVSAFFKASGYNFCGLREGGSGSWATFNLSTGSVVGTSAATTGAITSIGNGWYRCSMVFTSSTASSYAIQLFSIDNSYVSGTPVGYVFSGDATSGTFIWGAQLEQRSTVTAYTPTTSQPITNYIPVLQTAAAGVPRFDHDPVTGESKGFLIEEQRSNLLTYSSGFGSWSSYNGSNGNALQNSVSPDGSINAWTLEDTSNSGYYGVLQTPTISTSTSYCFSVYVKQGSSSSGFSVWLIGSGGNTYFQNTISWVGGMPTASGWTASSVGNGWYRVSYVFNSTTSTSVAVYLIPVILATSATGSTLFWGAQLEVGSFATSYIPTTSAQVTRSADAAGMFGSNFSSWYRADEGTLYAQCTTFATGTSGRAVIEVNDGTMANRTYIYTSPSGTSRTLGFVGGSAVVTTLDVVSPISSASIAYKTSNWAASYAGGNALLNSYAGVIPNQNTLLIGYTTNGGFQLNGTIKKLAYYPKRLSDAELQEMTQ